MDGWIKLHRKLLSSACAKKPEHLTVWIYLLLSANREPREMIINGLKIRIKPGQFVTSRLKIAVNTGVSESKVERILNYLKIEQQIEQVNFSTCRLISITNWHLYQGTEQVSEQQLNSSRTADEQQLNTNKKERKKEREKERSINTQTRDHHLSDDPLFDFEVFFEATRSVPSMQGWSRQKCVDIHQAMADWSASRSVNKRSDWLAVARTFERKGSMQVNSAGPRASQLTFSQRSTLNTIAAVERFGSDDQE